MLLLFSMGDDNDSEFPYAPGISSGSYSSVVAGVMRFDMDVTFCSLLPDERSGRERKSRFFPFCSVFKRGDFSRHAEYMARQKGL